MREKDNLKGGALNSLAEEMSNAPPYTPLEAWAITSHTTPGRMLPGGKEKVSCMCVGMGRGRAHRHVNQLCYLHMQCCISKQ